NWWPRWPTTTWRTVSGSGTRPGSAAGARTAPLAAAPTRSWRSRCGTTSGRSWAVRDARPPARVRERAPDDRAGSGPHDHLDGTVLLALEHVVGVRRVGQRHVVGGEVVDAERVLVGEVGDDVVGPAADVGLAHARLARLVERGGQRDRVGHAAVDAGQGDGAAAAHHVDGGVEGGEPVDAEAFRHRAAQLAGQQ